MDITPPLRDMKFVLFDVLRGEQHYDSLNAEQEVGRELIDAILDEAARFASGELAPINAVGDRDGCKLIDGQVTTPAGFKEAYKLFAEGGWAGLSGETTYGGQGLPESLSVVVEDLFSQANIAWSMYPGLSRGAIEALEAHGSEEQKQTFLTKLLSGEWTGTMCLTEPHCGSDVGLLRTRAEAAADGTYRVSGTKIFISAGDHDMANNIVHLVLARLPDAPQGTRGVSLIIVPKFNLDGTRNGVSTGAIEEKMGIHGNATCVLNFDDATGYMVGEPNSGMRSMFTMMNGARLVVGLQGVALAEAAYQKSLSYARERLQMRSLSGPKQPDKPADPIIVHPDVRRMLLTQKALVEGGRALVYLGALTADRALHGADEEERALADERLDFLTPIIKGFLTEAGFESANLGVQVFGGHGFIWETGIEQHVRDARITTIYEGTTGIQGLDLLGRKVLMTQGKALLAFAQEINELANELPAELTDLAQPLLDLTAQWGEMTMSLGGKAMQNPDEVGAASVDYLMYCGYACLAFIWAKMAAEAHAQSAGQTEPDHYLAGKIATARFYFSRLLPRTAAHFAAINAGAEPLMTIEDAWFDHI
ncbi:MAG: acyl-CoA dehydrogenase C-terminal domain-containing protein [Pseudomonadaceae bacterium]|nr:acyl-CoA dehydrogenase C-terminal domain-containing protein [Pseudomonadaceae bacterium]